MSNSTKSKADDTAAGDNSKPPLTTAAASATEQEEGAEESAPDAETPAPSRGRKKIQTAAMGLMRLMSPKEKSSVDGNEEEEEQGSGKKAEVDADDDAPPELPPVNPMAFNNSFVAQQANIGNRILYPPPNMTDIPPGSSGIGFAYPPLNIPGPNPGVHGGKSFPEILFEIVSNPNYQDIISWLPHGQGFQIHEKQLFAKRILPDYFDGTKFTSFTRRLKRWSFVRVSRGPELGAYYNKNFIRDQPELVQRMRYRLNEEGSGGGTAEGFPAIHGVRKRGLPDERDVTSTMGSMRQVHDGILPQMLPIQYQAHMFGAVAYGNDPYGLPQLPKPSQLPKRGTRNDGKGKDTGDDSGGAKGTDKSTSPSDKKKSKRSNFPSAGMMNAENGMMMMMMNNRMVGAFGGSGMAHYPNAGMSISYNNEDRPYEMSKQMMMSGGMGMSSDTQFSDLFPPSKSGNDPMANKKKDGSTATGSFERMGSLDTGGGSMMPKLGGPGGMQFCMPTDTPQGNTTHKAIMDDARKGLQL